MLPVGGPSWAPHHVDREGEVFRKKIAEGLAVQGWNSQHGSPGHLPLKRMCHCSHTAPLSARWHHCCHHGPSARKQWTSSYSWSTFHSLSLGLQALYSLCLSSLPASTLMNSFSFRGESQVTCFRKPSWASILTPVRSETGKHLSQTSLHFAMRL